MKLKVCGMKYTDNITEIAKLQPDYMGFIFYKKSSRFFNGHIPELPKSIKKVGVFVNDTLESIRKNVSKYKLQGIQLHGQESPDYCRQLKTSRIEIIKVFSIKDEFDFSILSNYEDCCDYFLFDTKGKLPGGNGYTFDWNVLRNYPSQKSFFISGGIGLHQIDKLKDFSKTEASEHCHAIDVNSRFEIEAGLKNSKDIKQFKNELQHRR